MAVKGDRSPAQKVEGAVPPPLAPRPAVVSALRRLLRPIVRLLLNNGITFPYLSDLLKLIYVETAEKEFGLDVRPLTDSRVTLLTGVHRKDVRRLRHEVVSEIPPSSGLTLGTRIRQGQRQFIAYLGTFQPGGRVNYLLEAAVNQLGDKRNPS